jgi:hypothetical protein
MDSKNTPRAWPIRQRKKDDGVVERDPWAPKPKVEALTPAIPGQTTAQNATDSMAAALEDAWRAYGEVVDVIGAITHATRLVGRGIAAESQKATIDLLSDDLAGAWARWDSAHRRILGPLPAAAGTD